MSKKRIDQIRKECALLAKTEDLEAHVFFVLERL